MSTNDTREEHAPSSVASKPELSQEDRSARIAVTVFPLIIIAAFALGLIFPTQAAKLTSGVNIGLGIIMFGMGLTLTLPDFALVVKRPLPVIVGVIAQYVIMPGVAFLLTKALNLDPAIAAGVILVGCAPGGTASNVISYLAKGDVALSVTMTSISTLLAPLMTPLLTKWLAGQYMPVDAKAMALAIVQIVLIPVIA
ncbi:bile acid:sodium symporter family protein, partial [Actinomyces sp.]